MSTKIVCISDIHGNLPSTLPLGDILIIAGDICPIFDHSFAFQKLWLETNFTDWLHQTQKRIPNIVYIAGNHDFAFEKADLTQPSWINWGCTQKDIRLGKGIFYLQDSGIKIGNLNIWGTPWQRRFFDWAFNLDEPELAKKWNLIPNNTNIIVCHGPAYSYGDAVAPRPGTYDETKWPEVEHVGSPSMLAKLDEIQPKLYVCGHIHAGYGVKQHGNTVMVNASYVNERYQPVNEPIIIEL